MHNYKLTIITNPTPTFFELKINVKYEKSHNCLKQTITKKIKVIMKPKYCGDLIKNKINNKCKQQKKEGNLK